MRMKGRDGRQQMTERLTTVKTTATRSRSMHPETNKLATKKPKNKNAAVSVLSLAISGWSKKKRFSAQIVRRA